jgi:hypothetical protein
MTDESAVAQRAGARFESQNARHAPARQTKRVADRCPGASGRRPKLDAGRDNATSAIANRLADMSLAEGGAQLLEVLLKGFELRFTEVPGGRFDRTGTESTQHVASLARRCAP